MKKFLFLLMLLCACVFTVNGTALAAPGDDIGWYWISSDDKYTKSYAPVEVKVEKYSDNHVPCLIKAITKTGYSFGGAKETLENYGLKDIQPTRLSYSIATVLVNPQQRTMAYVDEVFYDSAGQELWSKSSQNLKYKEINSQEFDEDFYVYIVDTVFGMGEVERSKADDRWLMLWQKTDKDGGTVHSMADTTTMRFHDDDNLIYWEWQEVKNPQGAVTEIRFQKKAVNLPQETEKIVRYMHWGSQGWHDLTESDTDGNYHAITKNSEGYEALTRLRVYEGDYEPWVTRYSLTSRMK